MGLEEIDIGHDELIRHERPELPPLEDVARYYALAEEARVYAGGPCRERLAARLAARLGVAGTVPVANGTLGLIVALREACGPASAERPLVATSSLAAAAGASAISWAGFQPLFVDVDPDTWQLDPAALAAALAEHGARCAGILAGSACGTTAPAASVSAWRALADEHGLALVIDSGAAFGAVDDAGRTAGARGEIEVFSFGASRPFAIGEGGAIVAPDLVRVRRLEGLAGLDRDGGEDAPAGAGLNAGMSELSAAAGLAMLDRYDDALARRRSTAAQLQEIFSHHPVTYQAGCERSTWPAFHIELPAPAARSRLVEAAEQLRVEVKCTLDPPLHRRPAFAGALCAGELPSTEILSARIVSLPVANSLGPRQMVRLAELLECAFADRRAVPRG